MVVVGSTPDGTAGAIEFFRSLGLDATGEASSAARALELVRESKPRMLLICANVACADPESIEAIQNELSTPVVLVAEVDYPEMLESTAAMEVSGFMVMPAEPATVKAILDAAMTVHHREMMLRQQVRELETALADRKVIERAKGLLMQRLNLTEEAAIQQLRRKARDTRTKLVDQARAVIEEETGRRDEEKDKS